MADNYNPEFEDPEIVDEAKAAIENKAKNAAKSAGKAVGKWVGKKIVKGAMFLASKIIGVILFIFNTILLPIITLMLPMLGILAAVALLLWAKDNWKTIVKFLAGIQYDTEALEAWNDGGDPEGTYQLYSTLDSHQNKSLSEKLKTLGQTDEEIESTMGDIDDLMRDEHLFLAPEDTLDLLQMCYEFNNEMFRTNWHTYEYHEWRLERNEFIGGFNYTWEEYPSEEHPDHKDVSEGGTMTTTNDDNVYGIVTRENIWGEELNGEKLYSVHWPDVMALAYYYSNEKSDDEVDGWGTDASSTYDPKEGTEYEINSVDNYYFSDRELKKLFQVFEWRGNEKWDAVNWPRTDFYWDSLYPNPRIAYRYSRIADPTDWGPFNTEPPAYDGERVTSTKIIPDSAPNKIQNLIEDNTYVYISTEEVPDYTPDPEVFKAPVGQYCVGKWRVLNPEPFIEKMAVLCPWYLERDSEAMREQMDYNWAAEMMDMYIFYLQLVEEGMGRSERTEYYTHIKDLYVNNQIEVFYYGMLPSDEEVYKFITDLEAANPGKAIVVNYDSAVNYGEFYSVTDADPKEQVKEGRIPFPSYGVTYHGRNPEKDNSGNSDVEHDYVGDVFISESNGHTVNGWIHLIEGADTPLDEGYYYSRDQIYQMILKLSNTKTTQFDWMACVDDVYEYNQATGADISALLAIILTEYSPAIGNPTYNWYNLTAGSGEPYFKTKATSRYNWWDPKTQFQGTYRTMSRRGGGTGYSTLEGCCMVECMDSIVRRYWKRGQNTFYTMCFNHYGYPQSWEEAEAAKSGITHAYCPWWDDTGFLTTGYNSDYMWCNKNAIYRTSFRNAAGVE